MPEAPPTDAVTRRIHALLAKAESTEFPAEAEALLAKAQQLMTRHAIDRAMLGATDARRHDRVTSRTITVERPYAMARVALLHAVAVASDCRVIVQGSGDDGGRQCVLVGHPVDLTHVLALFASLSIHATRCMLAAPLGADPPRRFRHAFLLAFAGRIGARLRQARESARREVETQRGQSTELVLVRRSAAVDERVAALFPSLRPIRRSASSWSGVHQGTRAADSAALDHNVVTGARRSLPGG